MVDPALISWLLAAETPSIRNLTLRRLLDRPEDDPDVVAARRAIMTTGPVPEILAGQTARGNWAGERGYYTPKYTSTNWRMILLAELGADGQDERVRRGAEFMLEATERELVTALEKRSHGMACFWGNLLRYTAHAGLAADPRAARVVEYLVREGPETGWRCPINYEHPCAWGAARALWGLAALPALQRTPATRDAVQSGVVFLLEKHHLERAAYPPGDHPSHLWRKLSFPLFYQGDILFVLRVLGEVRALEHPRARAALEWLDARRTPGGRWRGASPYRRRTFAGVGAETDRWVSLHAALVLEQVWSGCGMTTLFRSAAPPSSPAR